MTTAPQVQARADALLAPISDAAPGGENASYDTEYEAIKAEVGKLDSPTGGEVDWEQVAKGASALLSGRSKDILIGSYLAYALLQNEGLSGLAVGLKTLEGLLDTYWETMFPPLKRKRGRGNALGWLTGRLEIALPSLQLGAADRPALDLVIANFKAMGSLAREKLEDHAPATRSVQDALTRIDMKVPKAAAAPEPPPPAPAPAGPAAEPTPPAAVDPAAAVQPPAQAPAPAAQPPAQAPAPAAPAPAAPAPAAPAPAAAEAPAEKDLVAQAKDAAKAWLEPLGDPPHGMDAKYETEYEELRSEVGKLDSPTGDEVRWDQVKRLAGPLLKDKSKDLLVAGYLTVAKLEEEGLDGLNVGLAVLIGILEGFENQWPKRPRGRGNALSWFTEQLERRLAAQKLEAKHRDAATALQKLVKEFGGVVRDKLGEHAPSVRPVEERTQRMLLAIPKPEPKAEPKPKPAPTPAPAAAPTPPPAAPKPVAAMPTPTADVSNADDVRKFLSETGRALAKAGNLLRRAQLSSPAAYRLVRVGAWLHLDKAPPADAGGKTQIPGFDPNRLKNFGLMESNGKWDALIEECESAIMQSRFFLDLHFITANALQSLGADYESARTAVMAELAVVLARMPNLPELLDSRGQPLASDDTKNWIKTEVMAAGGEGGGGGGGGGQSDDPGELFAGLAGMMKAGKAPDAMKLAIEALEGTGSPRMRFIRRTALASACLSSDQPKLARSMFVALEREIDERGLADWEPRLASRCLAGLLQASRAAAKKGGTAYARYDAVLERLSLIDPAAAAKFAT